MREEASKITEKIGQIVCAGGWRFLIHLCKTIVRFSKVPLAVTGEELFEAGITPIEVTEKSFPVIEAVKSFCLREGSWWGSPHKVHLSLRCYTLGDELGFLTVSLMVSTKWKQQSPLSS